MPTLLLIIILAFAGVAGAQGYPENQYWWQLDNGNTPVIAETMPDSNFTVMSYALPNNPRCELIYGNHLYLGCGVFVKIYELDENGEHTLTGQIQTHDRIWDLEHDGLYLYVSNGWHGLTIYEGNNFVSPAEISNTRADYGFWKLCLYGDTLLFLASDRIVGRVPQ